MDHAGDVRGLERGQHLQRDLRGEPRIELAVAAEQARQILAAQVLHRDERLVVIDAAVVEHLHDADVADRAHHLGLVEEAVDDDRIARELRQQDLHRGGAAEDDVLGAVHDPHPALADLVEDAVFADHAADHDASLSHQRVGGLASRIAEPA